MAYEPLQTIIPSYLYEEYRDDPNLQAFVDAYNQLAQSYLTWFNYTPLGVYANPNVTGPLLDWIGQGVYGLPRPVFSSIRTRFSAGLNAFPVNAVAVNGSRYFRSGNATVASDDYYKRVLTWWLYAQTVGVGTASAGRYFNIEVLRLRVARFLYCPNGGDFAPPVATEAGGAIGTESGDRILLDPATDAATLAQTVHINPQFLAPPPAPVLSDTEDINVLGTELGQLIATNTGAPIFVSLAGTGLVLGTDSGRELITNTGVGIEVTGGAEGGQTYAVWLTYVNQIGETTPSPPSTIAVPSGQLFIVATPPQANGALDYNVYATILAPRPPRFLAGLNAAPVNGAAVNGTNLRGQAPAQLQTPTPIPIGTDWPEPPGGLIVGRDLPTENTTNRLGNFLITVPNVPAAPFLQQAFVQGGILSFPFMFTAEVLIEA